mmetsp:Transcript_22499/g.45298  ORF Transcript_22499/g.45298 Transcript_22499/m.45298 type:complete len:237 (+) Transcript_22499:148-858(+)|eukprot:CAMPEP_0113401112 /NCGR_PEP_ID=MMETSP0013_2-20120614/16508_1 /TAXON_ID=2843 ORGANISM="Skeletonema costatum, Strain 1716" /NCGR_SAMPLE_ID=MMETSP0013_2 /ASSEMBLY_ACC=CAM_ASM_000158 /LENGTH=236 /DNA_ID=CAMNT_0000286277 /DNA_START=998 /DNA_END=1708 /DNA_ORIENTATION=- /assembly_acc=CAM_ASM_000158
MNNIQSWSAFDEKVQNNNNDSSTTLEHNGVDSLYVSKKSENVAPAAVALLRQAGLTSSSSRNASNNNNNSDVEAVESEEEFRLRFHWMRPHPSLVFSLEEEMALKKKQEEECQPRQTNDHDKQRKSMESLQKPAPAVISARMMQVYRDAQVEQHEQQMDEDCENEVIMQEEEPNHSQSDYMKDQGSNISFANFTALLPFEHPELRVDLPSLVVPPLMTSWLPSAESIDTSYRDEQR